jgi:hypothetical protein
LIWTILFLYFLVKHSTTYSTRGIAPQNNLVPGEANSILLGKRKLVPASPWGETNSLFLGERQFSPFFPREKNKQISFSPRTVLSLLGIQLEEVRDFFSNHFVHGRKKDLREKSNLEPLVDRGDYNHWINYFSWKILCKKKNLNVNHSLGIVKEISKNIYL